MTDDPVTSLPAPAQPTQPAGKNPLDVLEEILGQSKKEAEAKQAEVQQAATNDAQLADAKAQMASQRVEDQVMIEQQLEQLKTIQGTPQYQARVSQEEAKVQVDNDAKAGSAGQEILQIKHTKI